MSATPTSLPMSLSAYDPRYKRKYTIPILHHDEDLLIINKPYDTRIDGCTESCPTIESILQLAFPMYKKLYLIHQLDYVTSGIHCWGLNKAMTAKCGKLFEARLVKKTYLAIVYGRIQDCVIDKPIAKTTEPQSILMCIGNKDNPGKPSKTFVKVIKYGYYGKEYVTLVELTPFTGRRHQLRVHLQSLGHPIVGDVSYEGNVNWVAERTMLHAWKIELPISSDYNIKYETENPFLELVKDKPHRVPRKRKLYLDQSKMCTIL